MWTSAVAADAAAAAAVARGGAFFLGMDARQFSQLCSFGGEQDIEVVSFALGSLLLALLLGDDAEADLDLHVERPGLHDGREGALALQGLVFDERADGEAAGQGLELLHENFGVVEAR